MVAVDYGLDQAYILVVFPLVDPIHPSHINGKIRSRFVSTSSIPNYKPF
jgi:hypothetical protein